MLTDEQIAEAREILEVECPLPQCGGIQHSTGRFDGVFYRHRVCDRCVEARKWLTKECGGWCFGSVLEDISEHLEHDPPVQPWARGRLEILVSAMGRQWEGWTPARVARLLA